MILSSAGDIEVAGEVARGDEAVAWAVEHHPDVVVMAIRLPGMDGITATAYLTAVLGERTKVVVLTSSDSQERERQARRAGATAFVSKRAAPDELIRAVRAVTSRGQSPAPEQAQEQRARPGVGSDVELHFTPALTSREREVLHLVAQGLSNAEIGERLRIAVDTVKSHLRHIYTKSGVANRTRLVLAARASGFSRRTA
jgi:DNA-binding NarL/FixJ family response regulator